MVAVFVALAGVVFVGCEKESEVLSENNEIPDFERIEIRNGILVFDTTEDLDYYTELFAKKSTAELNQWEKEIGFVSQESILEQVFAEEDAYFEQFDPTTMTDEEIAEVVKQKEEMGYTEFTREQIKKGIIKPYITENISSFELAAVSWVNPRFLNVDGLVVVDNVIYQFTETQCKKIIDGDFSKIEFLKQNATDNFENNIEVGNLASDSKDAHFLIGNSFCTGRNGNKYRSKMIEGEAWFRVWKYSTYNDFLYYIRYRNYKKNILGKWKEDSNADTYYSCAVKSQIYGSQSQIYSLTNTDQNRWANNIYIADIRNVPLSKTITFSLAVCSFQRDGVSIINSTPDNITW